jgi:hypothetical protein
MAHSSRCGNRNSSIRRRWLCRWASRMERLQDSLLVLRPDIGKGRCRRYTPNRGGAKLQFRMVATRSECSVAKSSTVIGGTLAARPPSKNHGQEKPKQKRIHFALSLSSTNPPCSRGARAVETSSSFLSRQSSDRGEHSAAHCAISQIASGVTPSSGRAHSAAALSWIL